MKAIIGVYDNHELALNAVVELKNAGYPVKNISIMGLTDTEDIDEELHVIQHNPLKVGGLATGTILGTTLGILTGIGMFAIPGIGFLYGAGAVVGAAAGFDFGLIGGGLASVIATLGVHEDAAAHYQRELEDGKYLLISQGDKEQVKKAEEILSRHATHSTLASHPVDAPFAMATKEYASEVPAVVAEETLDPFIENTVEKLDKDFPLSGGEERL